MRNTIQCCKHCVAPRRHIGCHGHCDEYITERKELDDTMAVHKDHNYDADAYLLDKARRLSNENRKAGGYTYGRRSTNLNGK